MSWRPSIVTTTTCPSGTRSASFRPAKADRELQYLDFQPGFFIDGRGVRHEKRAVTRQGFRLCFAQDDLYTVNFKGVD